MRFVEERRVRGAPGGVVRDGERGERVAVEGELAADEVLALRLLGLVEVLRVG